MNRVVIVLAIYGFMFSLGACLPSPPAFVQATFNAASIKAISSATATVSRTTNSIVLSIPTPRAFRLPYVEPVAPIEQADWVIPMLAVLDQTCSGFEDCESRAAALPLVGELGGYQFDETYMPDDLVSLAEYSHLYTLGADIELREAAVEPLRLFVVALNDLGYQVIVTSGFRTYEKQFLLHQDQPNAAVAAGFSQHQSGLAFDLYRLNADFELGNPVPFSAEIASVANRYGIVHPFEWDRPHFLILETEYPGLVQAMLTVGVDPNEEANILQALLALKQVYEELAGSRP